MTTTEFNAVFGDPFRLVFVLTFVLTFLAFPFVLAVQVGEPLGAYAGTLFFLSWLIGAFAFAVPLLFKSLVIAPLIFVSLVWTGRFVLPDLLTFILACTACAFASCFVAMRLNIDLFPPGLSWEPGRDQYGVPLGITAAVIAAFVAVPIWFGRERDIS